MKAAHTRLFGYMEIEDEKIIHFDNGIIGFPHLKDFTLINDAEEEKNESSINWLQSLDEPDLALPVMDPLVIEPNYDPVVEDEFLEPLGEMTPESTFVLVTVTVPQNIEEIAVNLKAPIIVNLTTNRAGQLIVENDYPVRYKIYDLLKENDERAGE